MSGSPVDILLSTWNGERYLPELLASLTAQTCREWRLLVRDDGSSDSSPQILRSFARKNPEQVHLPESCAQGEHCGITSSFFRLLRASSRPYILFCDQDDIWLPEKIALTLEATKALEAANPPGVALLVHTDLSVVDASLHTLAPSFWRCQGLNPACSVLLQYQLAANYVTGCTMLINRAMADLIVEPSRPALLHDRWLGLVAAAFGKTGYVARPTMLYRQHDTNDTGAGSGSPLALWRKFRALSHALTAGDQTLLPAFTAAQELQQHYGTMMSAAQRELISGFLELLSLPRRIRAVRLLRLGIRHSSMLRTLGLLLLPPFPGSN